MTRFLSAGQMMKQAQRTNGQNGREHRKKNEENELGWNRKWTKTAFKSKKKNKETERSSQARESKAPLVDVVSSSAES